MFAHLCFFSILIYTLSCFDFKTVRNLSPFRFILFTYFFDNGIIRLFLLITIRFNSIFFILCRLFLRFDLCWDTNILFFSCFNAWFDFFGMLLLLIGCIFRACDIITATLDFFCYTDLLFLLLIFIFSQCFILIQNLYIILFCSFFLGFCLC
ncbi:hypothetical protein HanRHA438_Chr09g0398201 [Helianthus annuus]|nr:hypothetical protein HanRHA438_Chr09g0398201 [Helianthus annuus]